MRYSRVDNTADDFTQGMLSHMLMFLEKFEALVSLVFCHVRKVK
jgi:hypothetical protein